MNHGFRITACLCVAFAGAAPASGQAKPDSLLRLAIVAAGGAMRLAAFPALEWDAKAAVHVPGRDIELGGLWRIQPPDSSIAATWEAAKGPASTRRMIVAGPRGWLQRDSVLSPMPPELLTEERHQFYLYYLLRLVPLRDSAVTLVAVPPDSAGNAGFRVQRSGRLPVTMYFDRDSRVTHLETTFAAADGKAGDPQDIRLIGSIEANGMRWFKRMEIRRSGNAYFEMELTALRPLTQLRDPLLAGSLKPD